MNVKKIREELGMSKYRFCRELGVSTTTVIAWEAGLFQPSEVNQKKIEDLIDRMTKSK